MSDTYECNNENNEKSDNRHDEKSESDDEKNIIESSERQSKMKSKFYKNNTTYKSNINEIDIKEKNSNNFNFLILNRCNK
jgi:hypothetical protein